MEALLFICFLFIVAIICGIFQGFRTVKKPTKRYTASTQTPLKINASTVTSTEFFQSNRDVIKGYQFCATLQFYTPLVVLEMHGKVVNSPSDIIKLETLGFKPQEAIRFGVWLPYLGKTSIEGSYASQFGSVTDSQIYDEILPLLKAYRSIVESKETPEGKFLLLSNLAKRVQKSQTHIKYILRDKHKHMGEFWAFQNLTAIQGIGPAKARKLIDQGIYTAHQYNQATQKTKPDK